MVDGLWRQVSDRYLFRALLGKDVTPAAMIAADTSSRFCRIRKLSMSYQVDHDT